MQKNGLVSSYKLVGYRQTREVQPEPVFDNGYFDWEWCPGFFNDCTLNPGTKFYEIIKTWINWVTI